MVHFSLSVHDILCWRLAKIEYLVPFLFFVNFGRFQFPRAKKGLQDLLRYNV